MLINGHPADTLPAADRAVQYGDGLFETLVVRNGQPCLWQRHMQRLQRGCLRLGIEPPAAELLSDELLGEIAEAPAGVAKIIVSRGIGARGYRPDTKAQASRIVSFTAEPDTPSSRSRRAAVLRLCDIRLGRNPALAGIKHLNRLEQVVARMEWSDEAIDEGLMLDSEERVIECTQSNLFLVKEGTLLTPDLGHSGVAGVLRQLVIDIADRLDIPLSVRTFGLSELWSAEAAFLTSSVIGLWPVAEIAGHRFSPAAIDQTLREQVMLEAFRP